MFTKTCSLNVLWNLTIFPYLTRNIIVLFYVSTKDYDEEFWDLTEFALKL